MVYAFVIEKPGYYYIVRVVTPAGFIVFQQRYEYWERARAQEFCDLINRLGAWNAGKGAA